MKATPWWRFTLGGSELVTGLTVASPHLIARLNALEMTPAIFLTLFAVSGRGVVDLRRWPPDFRSRVHSRLR